MMLTVLKSSFAKPKPKVINYCNTLFRDQVLNKLRDSNLEINDKDLKNFKETCLSVINTIVLLKSRFIRANQAPFRNKEIQRGVIVRSKLRKNSLKVDPKMTKKHTSNKEINALVYCGKPRSHTIRIWT